MATCVWLGNALAVTDVWDLTPGGTIEVVDKFNVTINGKTFSYSATGTTVASVCTGLVAAWNALSATDYAEHRELTASDQTTFIRLTANKSGVPIVLSVTTTESNGGAADAQTFSSSNSTVATGPNFWDNTANWSGAAVPVDSDDVILSASSVSILYGIGSTGVTLGTMTIDASYEGFIGLPERNSNGYKEYRDTYLEAGVTTLKIGQGVGNKSRRIKIDLGGDASAITVNGSGAPIDTGLEAILLKGTNASNTLTITEGSVGVAVLPGETANLSGGVTVGYETQRGSDARLRLGSGVTLSGPLIQKGGQVEANAAITTITREGGTMVHRGSGGATTVNNRGGTLFDETTGTYTTTENYAILDRRQQPAGKTYTTLRLFADSKTWIPHTATFTNAVEFYGCSNGGDDTETKMAEFDFGTHKKITIATI